MKYIFITWILFLGLLSQAQTIQDFFDDKAGSVKWLGIDYSHVTLRGQFTQFKDAAPISPAEIRDKYFPAWNSLMLNEAGKYDFKGMFMLSAMVPDIEMITGINAAADAEKMKEESKIRPGCEEMKGIAGTYDLKNKDGLGVVLIADVLDKTAEMASYFVIVLNMKTGEILFCEHVSEKAGGIGIRNYWGGSLYNLVKDGKKNLYWVWKEKYNK